MKNVFHLPWLALATSPFLSLQPLPPSTFNSEGSCLTSQHNHFSSVTSAGHLPTSGLSAFHSQHTQCSQLWLGVDSNPLGLTALHDSLALTGSLLLTGHVQLQLRPHPTQDVRDMSVDSEPTPLYAAQLPWLLISESFLHTTGGQHLKPKGHALDSRQPYNRKSISLHHQGNFWVPNTHTKKDTECP
jgi:hypothetical protein